jgi:hypothetical protein
MTDPRYHVLCCMHGFEDTERSIEEDSKLTIAMMLSPVDTGCEPL